MATSETRYFGQMKQDHLYQNDGKKNRKGKEGLMVQSTISSIKQGGSSVMAWACIAVNRNRVTGIQ